NDAPGRLKAELGDTVIEMRLPGPDGAGRAMQLLGDRVGGRVEREDNRLRITSDQGARVLVTALRVLGERGLEPETLTVREPSLDDVFLALTGHHAELSGAEPPERPEETP
ncbi:MAG TPA: daunorubicin/doxorubicin resistance ABC transporter ATP-binding protein DrrA, partial [Actinomycetota bacterium]|nr:daunorubicin/doxorubicin resistance ABC transporter ATP-binding protein DrrA [Actinomycetota bacterium]